MTQGNNLPCMECGGHVSIVIEPEMFPKNESYTARAFAECQSHECGHRHPICRCHDTPEGLKSAKYYWNTPVLDRVGGTA